MRANLESAAWPLKGSWNSRICSVFEPFQRIGEKMSPGHAAGCNFGSGDGEIVSGRGKYSVGLISPA